MNKTTANRCPECGGKFKPTKLEGVPQQIRDRQVAKTVTCKKCGNEYSKMRRRWNLVKRGPKKEDENK